jgi:uroporphyrinogen decarboxylase
VDFRTNAFLDACRNETPEHTPVWFMRQAGRSLPEYRSIRGTGSILEAIAQPDLVVEITLQPVRRYGVDAAIFYSDIMVPLWATGFGVDIKPGVGPVVVDPFRDASDLARIRELDAEVDTPFVIESVQALVSQLDVPLIGFAGAPFTLASYLIEGGPSKNYARTKALMHADPELWQQLTFKLADMSAASLRSQIANGCSAVQLFDSWAGSLSKRDYERFALPATQRVFDGIADTSVPRIHFGVGTGELLPSMATTSADVIGIDWRIPLDDARRRVGGKAIQGNLDPAICLAPWDVIAAEIDRILQEGGGKGHIFNLGHGVLPELDPDVLTRVVERVHAHR